ncbi:MAG: glycosyltransferase family 39 protein [Planctomycetota bacterium]
MNGTLSGISAFRKHHCLIIVLVLSFVVTVLNALKPIYIDDTYYYYLAEHIADEPLSPLDMELFWFQWPRDISSGSVPLVLPYWLSIGIKIFGERPFLWKLCLWPFIFIFVLSVYKLLERFAPRLKTLCLFMTVLSPAFLPSWNMMLDMPALALAVSAIAMFMFSIDRRSIFLAIVSGVIAGLAMQTKYSAAVAPLTILIYGFIFKRKLPGIIAATIAGAVFWAWEYAIYLLSGGSLFLYSLTKGFIFPPWDMNLTIKALFMIVGGVSIFNAMLIPALSKLSKFVVIITVAVLLGFVSLTLRPFERNLFILLGSLTALCVFAASVSLIGLRSERRWNLRFEEWDKIGVFLFLY